MSPHVPSPRIILLGGGWRESGGIANRTRLLARQLAERGWEVRVIGRAGTERRPWVSREPGIVACDLPGYGSPALGGLLFVVVATVLCVVWGRRTRAVLCLQLSSPMTVAALSGLVTGTPFLASTTTSGEFSEVRYLQATRTAVVRRWVARRAAWLVGQTEAAAAELRTLNTLAGVAVVPTPVSLPAQVPPLPETGRVGFVGRLSEEKQLQVLLDAWRGVVVACPWARLDIVGGGGGFRSVEAELRDVVASELDLRATVTFLGEIDDVRDFLHGCDVFVLPSRTEGMSNALLEACAEGRAVVASMIPGNVAVLGAEYPWLVTSGSVEELEEALVSLLSSTSLAGMCASVARSRAEHFSVDRVVDRWVELIEAAGSRRR